MLRSGGGGPGLIYKYFREISVSSSVILCRVIDKKLSSYLKVKVIRGLTLSF